MALENLAEPWNIGAHVIMGTNGNTDRFRYLSCLLVVDSGYGSETGCDDNWDLFYFTPEFEDSNEV